MSDEVLLVSPGVPNLPEESPVEEAQKDDKYPLPG